MKKKLLTILVCAAVMLTTACDKSGITSTPSDSSSTSTKSSSESSKSESSSSESSTAESESSSTESESSTTENESSTTTESESSAPENGATETDGFVHGNVAQSSYSSEFLGIKADFADGWVCAADDMLAENNGVSDMSAENVNSALDTKAILYELIATTEGISNVNIVIENLNITNGGKALSGEEYIELAFDNVTASFKNLGIEEVDAEKSKINFLGSEMACMKTKLASQGQEMVQVMIPINKGAYMGIVTFSGETEDDITSAMTMFKSI
ncbi:MAG: hypothetical protein HDT43_06860 [Ruminococcaceae bacterium]|nr:hypothetical protein [Oscillospiraceae bacterium]